LKLIYREQLCNRSCSNKHTHISTIETNISTIETDISTIETNISTIETDISTIETNILTIETDISTIETNISTIETNISTIETNISTIETDISTIETNISTIETDVSQNKADISQNLVYISLNRLDIDDISSNKDFIRHLQSVEYSIVNANAPAQWPIPPIKSGYNGVFCTNTGIDIIAQNFLTLDIGTPSVLSFQSDDTSDNIINIISKGLNFIIQ